MAPPTHSVLVGVAQFLGFTAPAQGPLESQGFVNTDKEAVSRSVIPPLSQRRHSGLEPHLWGSLTYVGFCANKLQRELTRECGAVLVGPPLCFEGVSFLAKAFFSFFLPVPCLMRTMSTSLERQPSLFQLKNSLFGRNQIVLPWASHPRAISPFISSSVREERPGERRLRSHSFNSLWLELV